jgi:hypothetical protein
MAVPFAVADTVFAPTTVELSVPVATPFAPVVPVGCVSVFPVPVAESTTVAPLIGFPPASFTVTVIVAVPLPAVIALGATVTVDWPAETAPAVTVTAAVCVMAVPFAVAETVFVPTTVELSVPVATPFAFVGPAGWVSVFPLPVAESTTVAPLIGLPLSSFTVTVMLEAPLACEIVLGAAATVVCSADTGPGVAVTSAVCVRAVVTVPIVAVADTVFVSATVVVRLPL